MYVSMGENVMQRDRDQIHETVEPETALAKGWVISASRSLHARPRGFRACAPSFRVLVPFPVEQFRVHGETGVPFSDTELAR